VKLYATVIVTAIAGILFVGAVVLAERRFVPEGNRLRHDVEPNVEGQI
jgi:hypothetical protein